LILLIPLKNWLFALDQAKLATEDTEDTEKIVHEEFRRHCSTWPRRGGELIPEHAADAGG
jgi:hypothetical protein